MPVSNPFSNFKTDDQRMDSVASNTLCNRAVPWADWVESREPVAAMLIASVRDTDGDAR